MTTFIMHLYRKDSENEMYKMYILYKQKSM